MKSGLKKGIFIAGVISILSFSLVGQIDQKIYYQYCVIRPDTSCFVPVEGAVDTVGVDVGALGGSFRFCLQVDTVDSGYAPVRVILVIDKSYSMCRNPPDSQCCTAGDGSGNCMMNDPYDMRIKAALAFVDSLAIKSPTSEVGVVLYTQAASIYNPLSLDRRQNIDQIHRWIESGSCVASGWGPTEEGIGKKLATKATYLGQGLDAGLRAADYNYNNIPAGISRHIIQLTDGAWDDTLASLITPDTIINRYKATYPGREVPKVHGVFLSNAELHTAHGYPPEGCSSTEPVILGKLERATQITGGLYFPASTPNIIIENFQQLLDTIANTAPQQLISLVVTNEANNESRSNGPITQVSSSIATWQTTLQELPLEMGDNPLTLTYTIRRPGGKGDITITTHVKIVKTDRYRETLDLDLYKKYCELVSANIKITATPESQGTNQPFNVTATISGSSNFHIDTVQVRIFTNFPDNENGVIATFHLDGNLVNSSGGGEATGSSNINFTTTDYLFGKAAVNVGSFSYNLPQLNGDFVIEEWVKPGAKGAAVLFNGNGIEIGVDNDMNLYLKNGDVVVVKSAVPLDVGVWSHIGVARAGGKVTIFINGIAVSESTDFTGAIPSGSITVNTPQRWIIDEVRFNNVSRITTDGSTKMLIIPTISKISWTVGENTATAEMVKVPPSLWTDGSKLDFTFTSPVGGRFLVNIRQKQVGGVGTGWSKNSNPITVAPDMEGPLVKIGILTPGSLVGNNSRDTLKIQFTEPVNCETLKKADPSKTFLISRDKEDRSDLLQGSVYADQNCASKYITEVILLVKPGIIPESDSIRITGITAVIDTAGNSSPEKGKKADIVWGEGINVNVYPLESKENKMNIDPGVANRLQIKEQQGKVVAITSIRPFKKTENPGGSGGNTFDQYGYVMIYDAVGNLVASELPIRFSNIPGIYYVVWDGTNRNKRRVGSGTYLFRFYFEYTDGSKGVEKAKVMIRW